MFNTGDVGKGTIMLMGLRSYLVGFIIRVRLPVPLVRVIASAFVQAIWIFTGAVAL